MAAARILVVDDEPAIRRALSRLLEEYEVDLAEDGLGAIRKATANPYDLVITDLRMPGADGLEVIKALHARQPGRPVIMLTAHGSIGDAVAAMRAGAVNFIPKPFHREELQSAVRDALAERQEPPDATGRRERPQANLIGNRLSAVLELIQRVADHDATVLITGESGTGKELVARLLHTTSRRAGAPFVAVNCGAIPESLIESELFGHAKGAFTGATQRRLGHFALADGGTLFLDEIGDLPLSLQVKLIRVLQEKEFTPVGESRPRHVDVRVVAATLCDVEEMVARGEFREDLYYRLNVIPIELPSLREAPNDVPLLASYFLDRANGRSGRSVEIAPSAIAVLQTHRWPGNVRELENLIERLVLIVQGDVITPDDLPDKIRDATSAMAAATKVLDQQAEADGLDLPRTLAEIERQVISEALRAAGGNKTRAAAMLKINRTTLIEKLKRQD